MSNLSKKITFENKEDLVNLNSNSKYVLTAENINEIKDVVNSLSDEIANRITISQIFRYFRFSIPNNLNKNIDYTIKLQISKFQDFSSVTEVECTPKLEEYNSSKNNYTDENSDFSIFKSNSGENWKNISNVIFSSDDQNSEVKIDLYEYLKEYGNNISDFPFFGRYKLVDLTNGSESQWNGFALSFSNYNNSHIFNARFIRIRIDGLDSIFGESRHEYKVYGINSLGEEELITNDCNFEISNNFISSMEQNYLVTSKVINNELQVVKASCVIDGVYYEDSKVVNVAPLKIIKYYIEGPDSIEGGQSAEYLVKGELSNGEIVNLVNESEVSIESSNCSISITNNKVKVTCNDVIYDSEIFSMISKHKTEKLIASKQILLKKIVYKSFIYSNDGVAETETIFGEDNANKLNRNIGYLNNGETHYDTTHVRPLLLADDGSILDDVKNVQINEVSSSYLRFSHETIKDSNNKDVDSIKIMVDNLDGIDKEKEILVMVTYMDPAAGRSVSISQLETITLYGNATSGIKEIKINLSKNLFNDNESGTYKVIGITYSGDSVDITSTTTIEFNPPITGINLNTSTNTITTDVLIGNANTPIKAIYDDMISYADVTFVSSKYKLVGNPCEIIGYVGFQIESQTLGCDVIDKKNDEIVLDVAPSFTLKEGESCPAGLSLATDGLITGTPTTKGTGSFISMVSCDGAGTIEMTVNYLIKKYIIRTTGCLTSITGFYNEDIGEYQLSSDVIDEDTNEVVDKPIFAATLPAGLSLSSNGLITGTPTIKGNGTFKVTASHQHAQSKQITISYNIKKYVIKTSGSKTTIDCGKTTFSAFDIGCKVVDEGNNNAYIGIPKYTLVSGTSLPSGLSLSSSGRISGTPSSSGSGSFEVKLTYEHAEDVTITISYNIKNYEIDTSNQETSLSGEIDIYTSLSFNCRVKDLDTGNYVSGVSLSYEKSSGSLPEGLSVSSSRIYGSPETAGSGYCYIRVSCKYAQSKQFRVYYNIKDIYYIVGYCGNKGINSSRWTSIASRYHNGDVNQIYAIPVSQKWPEGVYYQDSSGNAKCQWMLQGPFDTRTEAQNALEKDSDAIKATLSEKCAGNTMTALFIWEDGAGHDLDIRVEIGGNPGDNSNDERYGYGQPHEGTAGKYGKHYGDNTDFSGQEQVSFNQINLYDAYKYGSVKIYLRAQWWQGRGNGNFKLNITSSKNQYTRNFNVTSATSNSNSRGYDYLGYILYYPSSDGFTFYPYSGTQPPSNLPEDEYY